MWFLLPLLFAALPSQAHPGSGHTSVIVVMKMAACSVCQTQLRTLGDAELEARVRGITHDGEAAAARVTRSTGVPTYSHAAGIRSMGLWLEDAGMAMPAVVVYDRCGDETGRVVGRRPGVDVTDDVRTLVEQANAVGSCGKPVS